MLYILIIAILAIDQISKLAIQNTMQLNESIVVIEKFFYLNYVRNTGAAWSIFAGKQFYLSVISIIAIIAMIIYLYKIRQDTTKILTCYAISLMIAGAIGNLIDRISFQYVRDFLSFYPFGYAFPVFNVADIALSIGVVLLIFEIVLDEMREKSI